MKGRVLLINPHPEKVAQKRYHSMPVLGIGYLASALIKEGFDCGVIDGKMEGLSLSDMVERTLGFNPDVLGISSMTNDIVRAHELAQVIKNRLPELKVIIGGPHATALPNDTLKQFPAFDALVAGEGERSIVELLHSIHNSSFKRNLSHIKGIAYRKEDQICINRSRDFIEDLDSLDFPAWRLFPRTKAYAMYTSRGCPFDCNFCMRAMGNRLRFRSPENVIAELKLIISLGGEYVFFRDETFTVSRKHFARICELIVSNKLNKKFKWACTTHCSAINHDVLKLMKEAGCDLVEFGIESGNDEILKRMGKRLNKEIARKAVKAAKEVGLKTFGNFILGHPYETKETIQQTIDFAKELNTTHVSFGAMVPYPGTEIYEMAKKGEGGYKNLSSNWSSFDKYQGGAIDLEGVSKQDLARAQMKAFTTFYFKNFRLVSAFKFFLENRTNIIFYVKRLVKELFAGKKTCY